MRLSTDIRIIFAHSDNPVTVREILDRVSVKSFGIFLVILSMPSALPVPAPGYSIPFGLALLFLGIQVVLRRDHPWFPERVLKREIHIKENSKAVNGMVKFLSMFEKVIRPRFTFVYGNPVFYRLMGCVIMLCSVSMLIPIPLTNTLPALGIFLIGLGMLEEDGFFGIFGTAVGVGGVLFTLTLLGLIAFFGMEAVGMVRDFIKSALGMG